MLVIGLDTTGRIGSVALVRDGAAVGAFAGDPARPHAQRLPGDILALLDQHGLRPADVDVFAVAAGPGSFTGLRIGIAAIQGLAFATGRPVVGISALEALAHAAGAGGPAAGSARVGVWMDAQREEVFAAVYERDGAVGPWRLTDGPTVDLPASVAARWRAFGGAAAWPVVGDGAVRYRAILEEVLGPAARVIEPPPIAPSIAMLGWQRALDGEAGLPHAIRPLYVRRPDAELARDRAAFGTR
jgi:tRNA threonylcarbamoyladenosine biosynthesis protein TsaB